ncbi:hypothetical protein [Corynebacterium mayonis]
MGCRELIAAQKAAFGWYKVLAASQVNNGDGFGGGVECVRTWQSVVNVFE